MIYAIAFILLQACDPALAALFAPPHPVLGRYEVCAAPDSIDRIVSSPEGLRYRLGAIEPTDPLDAIGAAGAYDRLAVARLYGGSRPRVARGWRRDGDQFESITLVSPYPDVSLTRLVPGTLVIRWIIEGPFHDGLVAGPAVPPGAGAAESTRRAGAAVGADRIR
jgi:hypothetical protein